MRAAIYVRVSTLDQNTENQAIELRRYVESRGWTAIEYRDAGISGTKDRRPALDQLVSDAKRRAFDVLVVWRLDRLGRNLRHLVTLIDELNAVGCGFASLGEGIDTQTPAGRLQLHILAALAEFERERIRERVYAGLARARGQGTKLGRPRLQVLSSPLSEALTVRSAAARWKVSKSTAARRLSAGRVPAVNGTIPPVTERSNAATEERLKSGHAVGAMSIV